MTGSNKKPLIIIAGPTASGKTECSVLLAKKAGGEIISADSMQVYKGMDIGSAKIMPDEMQGIPHYGIDILEPDEEFNVTVFQKTAMDAMGKIQKNGHIPMIVGGTGFYIQSVLYNIDFTETTADDGYRSMLESKAKDMGAEVLHEELKKVDPASADAIHPNNVKRVIRALEYFYQTGEKISEHNAAEKEKESPYNYAFFVLTDDRKKLYERIDTRVDSMLQNGLVEEVKRLMEKSIPRTAVSMQGLGYKEIYDYLIGDCTLEEAVYRVKRDTRHFAKRQLTWFRREKDVIWLDRSVFSGNTEKMTDYMVQCLKEKGII